MPRTPSPAPRGVAAVGAALALTVLAACAAAPGLAPDRPAATQHGVPAAVLVAIWGMESSYGANHGDVPVIGALATLGFDGRREAWGAEVRLPAGFDPGRADASVHQPSAA